MSRHELELPGCESSSLPTVPVNADSELFLSPQVACQTEAAVALPGPVSECARAVRYALYRYAPGRFLSASKCRRARSARRRMRHVAGSSANAAGANWRRQGPGCRCELCARLTRVIQAGCVRLVQVQGASAPAAVNARDALSTTGRLSRERGRTGARACSTHPTRPSISKLWAHLPLTGPSQKVQARPPDGS